MSTAKTRDRIGGLDGRQQFFLVTFCLAAAAWVVLFVVARRPAGGFSDVDATDTSVVRYRVDPNKATWIELAQLPEVGAALAQRIVESRARDGDFLSAADLMRVHGLGPAKVTRIRPYLINLPRVASAASGSPTASSEMP